MNFASSFGFDPLDVSAEAIDANDAWKELQLAAGFTLLEQELAGGSAFPLRLVDFVDLG